LPMRKPDSIRVFGRGKADRWNFSDFDTLAPEPVVLERKI
jgi:hypothetical protein